MEYLIEYYCTSHRGNLRSNNQDNFCCLNEFLESDNLGSGRIISGIVKNDSFPVFAVFDGMGGEECGEMAAHIAAAKLSEYQFTDGSLDELAQFCKGANDEICAYTDEHLLSSMGTTAAILLFAPDNIHLCNIGDSKIFRFSDGVLEQISYDHVSVAAFGSKPPLTQNLGIKEEELIISPYLALGEYHSKDAYLICSDGLTDMVTNDEISHILSNTDKDSAAASLMQKALDNGGKDNITLILLYLDRPKRNYFKEIIERMRDKHGND